MFDKLYVFTKKALQDAGVKIPFSKNEMGKYSTLLSDVFNKALEKALKKTAQSTPTPKETISIIKNYIPINKFSRSGQKKAITQSIVLHYTAAPGSAASAVQYYFSSLAQQENNKPGVTYGSSQLTVGLEGEVLQMMDLDEVAYHAGGYPKDQAPENTPPYLIYKDFILPYVNKYGNPNWSSVGIEMCIDRDWKIPDKTFQATARLTAYLCQAYNLIPEVNIYRHGDITYKECPKPWFDDSTQWDAFKKQVRQYYDASVWNIATYSA